MSNIQKQSGMRIRLARLGDARQIALMARREIENGLTWTWTPDRIRAAIRSPECIVLAAVRNRQLCGFALVTAERELYRLCLLAVAQGVRRRGVARQLVITMLQMSRKRGCREVRLETRLFNLEARALYRALGFRLVSHIPNYYDNNEAAAVMALQLQPQRITAGGQPGAPAFCA